MIILWDGHWSYNQAAVQIHGEDDYWCENNNTNDEPVTPYDIVPYPNNDFDIKAFSYSFMYHGGFNYHGDF